MSGAVDVSGILERSGANPNAVEGTQAWALAQVDAAVAELIEPISNLCSGLPHQHADLVAVLGASNAYEVMRTRAALARVKGGAA